ncbi:receptor-type tyrosine-protein phosphatase F-like [Xenia sp. Carnegie-2017]|uniref:receptor-type tyrosine-protein phosphatase F-like n=1 Tax=Xenia sp. Carnegie-2017 TaxID=2897299 RepID=UPI001F04885B|nr:receptor-type tyrosine-protein phosphatase F-like [Xenia sp. Carnegie-2017]
MVIKVAEYRGLSNGSSCGSSYDYSCSVNVTCDLKNYCDGETECTITVDDNHFPSNICPGLEKYLYFEYQCNDTSMPYRKIGHLPDGPPLNVTIYAIGNTSLFVTWKPPDVTKRNGKIVSYTVCIKQCGGDTCSKNHTTEEQHLKINHLKPATKYCVRVLASTKVGPGIYSKLKWTFSNGLAPEQPRIQTAYSLTYLLRIPSMKYQYFYVVAMEHDKKEIGLPSNSKMMT